MRFTIVLALCFIGAASASSLNKRSFLDDIQNNTQNAFHAFEQFGQTFNEKVQEALKNLLSAFGNKNSSAEASVSVSKRATNPLQLINDLDDPAQFAQTFLKVLLDLATGQGRRKRDIAEDLKKFSEEAKHNAEEALKKLFSFLEQFKSQSSESTEAPVVVEKRATNPLVLINDLSDPAKFAQDFLKVLADMATGQGRRKRDIAEDLKKFSDEAKQNAEEALKKLFSFLEQFKPQSSESTEAPVVVEKRATNPLVLINDLSDPAKFAQDFLKVLADMATGQGRRKRDVAEDLKKFADSAKQNAEQGLAKLFEFLEQFKAQFAHDQTDAEKVVSKRDIQETIEKFNELAQTKAQEAFKNIKQALDDLFKGNPFFQSISSHFNNGEDSTEKTVSKRDIFDNFEKFSQNAFENFKQSFERFFNQFSNDDAEAESSTESD